MSKLRFLALIDLIQDIDVLLPVLLAIRNTPGWSISVWVSHWLDRASPRARLLLKSHGFPALSVRRQTLIQGGGPNLSSHDVLLTASESTAAAHAAGHALVLRAKQCGLHTATFQHGLENVGLSPEQDGNWERFGSATIFCWFDAKYALPEMPTATRARLVSIGRPTMPRETAPPRFDLGVFENLHWDRYNDDDRSDFVRSLINLTERRPDLRVYVRSHPAGGWLDGLSESLNRRTNITFSSADASRRAPQSGAEAVAMSRRIITTPSTVALDGAMAGHPVALVGQAGSAYAPLTVLQRADDWLDFADGHRDGTGDHAFLIRHLATGDWRRALTDHLSQGLNP